MSLVITARLVTGTYDAATPDPARRTAEWPPHPLRLFSALVDAAQGAGDATGTRAALRWLESLSPPEVWAAVEVESSVRSTYVPVNDLPKEPKHTLYPGRMSARDPKSWPRAIPARTSVRFVWRDAVVDDDTFSALSRLAARVPYLGRASSPVVVAASRDDPPPAGEEGVWAPEAEGEVALRVPFPGSLAALEEAYAAGAPPHDVSASAPYRGPAAPRNVADQTDRAPVRAAPFSNLLTFVMRPAPGLDASYALAITSALRRAVISRIGTNVPASVHGHDPGVPHVVWLALPWVQGEHASGRVMGVGVAIPDGTPAADRLTLVRALLGSAETEGMTRLTLPPPLTRHGSVEIRPWEGQLTTVAPETWTAGAAGARRWASVTPVVWDRFSRGDAALEDPLRQSIRRAGLPEPAPGGLAWSRAPFVRAGARPRPDQVRREGDPPLPFRHVLVEFPEPVRGPVVLGRMRHFGVGLLSPLVES